MILYRYCNYSINKDESILWLQGMNRV